MTKHQYSRQQPRQRAFQRRLLLSLLVASVFMQSVLAFLAAPVIVHAHDSNGQQVTLLLCTLKGEQFIDVDMPKLAGDDPQDECPALELLQLASSAAFTTTLSIPQSVHPGTETNTPRPIPAIADAAYTQYTSRAPPRV